MDTFFGPLMWAIHLVALVVIGVGCGGPGVAAAAVVTGFAAAAGAVLLAVLRAAERASLREAEAAR